MKHIKIITLICFFCFGLSNYSKALTKWKYTTNSDFDKGVLVNLNYNEPNENQLQMNKGGETKPYPFIVIACSNRGTAVRINTKTGKILGEYLTAPDNQGRNPSRTTVDLYGNVWIGNRDEASSGKGSVVKIGVVIGGIRCDSDGISNPAGEYLSPPFVYNTCIDRNGDGLIKTSCGLGDIRPWSNPDRVDSSGGVLSADDEAILLYARVNGTNVRHVSINSENNVWVGGYSNRAFDLIDGESGSILTSFNVHGGGYGGLIDSNGVIWSSTRDPHGLLRYDTKNTNDISDDSYENLTPLDAYGLAIDPDGNIWHAQYLQNNINKYYPDGTQYDGFPKTTVKGNAGITTRGVAVTPSDKNVWVACSHGWNSQEIGDVTRLDNDGNIRKHISVGKSPTGVAVDSDGKVWVSNRNSNNVMRINPNGDGDGLGKVDLIIHLGDNAGPYNYSDMTGIIALQTAKRGRWNVVHDSTEQETEWDKIEWKSYEPDNTLIKVVVRSADRQSDLSSKEFISINNAESLVNIIGQFIEVQVDFINNSKLDLSPILYEITLNPKNDEQCILVDSDNDGVIDQWDSCPKTPENSCVNNKGCSCELSIIDEKGSVAKNKWKTYYAKIDNTYSNFIVKIQNLSDDVDLYVKKGNKPDINNYDCRPYKGGTRDEVCELSNSGDNLWYFAIFGYKAGDFNISVKTKR